MEDDYAMDPLTKARWAGIALIVTAALLALVGSFLDWVTIEPPPTLPDEEAAGTQPFTGVEARDGWIVVGASGFLLLFALGVAARGRSLYGWLAFLTSMFIGSIAVADYRGLTDFSSAIAQRMDLVGRASPAIGLIMVAAAGLIGILGALIAVAGSPRSATR